MGEFLTDLLKRSGPTGLAFAVALALSVWYLAHMSAAPGTPVRVLWGLVEYTKAPDHSTAYLPSAVSDTPSAENQVAQIASKMAPIEAVHGVTSTTEFNVRKSLREQYGLRLLRSLETGKKINQSPAGTYFFVSPNSLRFRKEEGFSSDDGPIGQAPIGTNIFFEIQHRGDGELVVIAFAAEVDANRLQTASGDKELSVVLAPDLWEAQTSLVEVPARRFISAVPRQLELEGTGTPYVLDAEVR